MRILFLFVLAFSFMACSPAVRDKTVYEAEIDFVEAAATEQVEHGVALIKEMCKCDEIGGVKVFVDSACHDLAETIMVVQSRLEYHTAFMRYLGGISDERPPEKPPEVPEASTLCP